MRGQQDGNVNNFSPRRLLKVSVFGLSLILTAPLIAIVRLEKMLSHGEALFASLSQLLSLIPGKVGVYLRAAYYYATLDECSWETHIGFGSIFTHRGARLAANVSMGVYCVIGHATLGAGVIMASRISIPSGRRQHFDDAGQLSAEPRFDRVTIGPKTWVGEGAIVMADVGSHCIVSAGAVVTRKMPDHSLVGGNPARVIRRLGGPAQNVAAG